MKRDDVMVGIVVAGLVLLIGCRLVNWVPGMVIGGAMVLCVLVASWSAKRAGRGAADGRKPGGHREH